MYDTAHTYAASCYMRRNSRRVDGLAGNSWDTNWYQNSFGLFAAKTATMHWLGTLEHNDHQDIDQIWTRIIWPSDLAVHETRYPNLGRSVTPRSVGFKKTVLDTISDTIFDHCRGSGNWKGFDNVFVRQGAVYRRYQLIWAFLNKHVN